MVWRWSARQHGDGRGRGTGRAAARRRAAGVRDAACTRAGVRADRVRVLVWERDYAGGRLAWPEAVGIVAGVGGDIAVAGGMVKGGLSCCC